MGPHPLDYQPRPRDKVHFWVTLRYLYPSLFQAGLYCCWFCGVIRQHDPAKISKCSGAVGIDLRAAGAKRREP